MKVIKTNRYKVIFDIPQYKIGDIINEKDVAILVCENYPKIFTPIYAFVMEDKSSYEIVKGQNIWRLVTQGNGVKEVKSMQFDKNHVNMDIYPSYELARIELEKYNETLEKLNTNSYIRNILEQIHVETYKSPENLSINRIIDSYKRINELSKKALNLK